MPRKKTSPEKIISLLRQIEVQMASGATLPQACKQAQISTQSYYRWRQDFGGDQLGLALCDGAGLVQGDGLDLPGPFQMDAALDQDAAAGGGGKAAHHRHRGGDHQRARAGDDQEHEGFVDGLHPGPAHQPRRQEANGQAARPCLKTSHGK